MSLRFCSVASGSSGNSYIVSSGNTNILVDAGVSLKRITAGLGSLGLGERELSAVLITHEHSDHIRSLAALCRRLPGVPVFASCGTWAELESAGIEPACERYGICAGEILEIGDIEVRAFSLSHDAAEALGYSFSVEDAKMSIVTDTGCITAEIFEEIRLSNLLVLEANYEDEMLLSGRYPFFLKERIRGEKGHLSNAAAARAVLEILRQGEAAELKAVLLAHLSKENNHPALAYQTVRSFLQAQRVDVDGELMLGILKRDEQSPVYTLNRKCITSPSFTT